jgi:sigma-B regulation protein RsbU (phosphoserine phosphatase)
LATNGLPIAGTCDEPRIVTDRYTPSPTHAASADGEFVYSNAGHNSQALLAPDGIWRLGTGGPNLGTLLDAESNRRHCAFNAANTMVMFTDGVTEACTARDEEFGEDRLMACLSSDAASLPVVLNRIFTSVREFCQRADQTDGIPVTVTRYG